jgi:ribonuclease HI
MPVMDSDIYVRWNNNNFNCTILNVDGSCIGSPTWAGFGGLIRNSAGFYLSGFLGFLPSSSDILQAELTAIYHDITLAIDMGISNMAVYSDSLLSINLITGISSKFHIHAVLIQDIRDKLSLGNFSLHHTLREGNQSADYLAKLDAISDVAILIHQSPPDDLRPLLKSDASGTMFLRS